MPAKHHSRGGGGDDPPQSVHETILDQPLAKPLEQKPCSNIEGSLFEEISYDENRSSASTEQIGEQGMPVLQPLNRLNRSPTPITNRWPTIRPLPESLKHATALLSDFADNEFATTILFCCLIPSARAADGDDTMNNLFSDLAPILALFGEQVAKQFLSEGMGWADNILFAVAPLGVITGIISAIRVGGPPWLKAIVGRAREGRADVELELMSSNSLEVGEMWNGQTIVRVVGTPSIFQLVYSAEETTDDPASYIKTLHDGNGFFRRVESRFRRRSRSQSNHEDDYNHPIELRRLIDGPSDHLLEDSNGIYPPNISLNARGEPVSDREKWAWALIGVSTQLTVLVYQGLISYYASWKYLGRKRDKEPSIQAFLLTATGTVALTFGMLICSYVVESSSSETDWWRTGRHKALKVAWIQRGGTVGDQVFEPYLIFGHEGQQVVRTSQRCNAKMGIKLQYWVLLGTFISVGGFIVQFTGLRGMSWSATLVQLAATGFMTAVRSIVRRRMSREPTAIKTFEGHELDCMARTIGGCDALKIIPEGSRQTGNQDQDQGRVNEIMRIRKHLGELTQWPTDIRPIESILCTAIEKTMDALHGSDDIEFVDGFLEAEEMSWKIGVLTMKNAPPLDAETNWFGRQISAVRRWAAGAVRSVDDIRRGELIFKLTRSQSSGGWGPWAMSEETKFEMTTLQPLSLLRFREEESYFGGHGKTAKVLRAWPRGVEQDHFRSWMGAQGIDLRFRKLAVILRQEGIPAHRVIGNMELESDDGDAAVVLIPREVPMETLLAQQLFSDFFSAVVPRIKIISGTTSITPANSSVDHAQGLFSEYPAGDWVIENSALAQLAEIVCETGLGTKQEVLMGMIPHLERDGKLPLPLVKSGSLIQRSFLELRHRRFRARNDWHILASEIQQLARVQNQNHVDEDLQTWSVRSLETRFCKRVLALATPGGSGVPGKSDHPHLLFLEWLGQVSIANLPLVPGGPRLQSHLIDLPDDVVKYLGEEKVAKLGRLLAPFGPLSPLVESDLELLKQTFDITTPRDLARILRKAASDGYDLIVEALCDRGLDPMERDETGESPLTLAASAGHDSVVQLLLLQLLVHSPLVHGEFQAGYQLAALWNAAKNGHISTVKLLIMLTNESGVTHVQQRNTALILAAGNGHEELVKVLLADGADTRTGRTVLSRSQWDEVRRFFQRISKLGVRDYHIYGREELEGEAGLYAHLVPSILNHPANNTVSMAISMRTPLQAAVEGVQMTVVEHLLNSGAQVNARAGEYSGRTALQAAAGLGHLVMVDRLLRKGAEVNAAPGVYCGRTALQGAAGDGHLAVVDRLLMWGAEVNAQPGEYLGRTALQAAAGGGHLAVVDRLLEKGAEVNAQPGATFGRTALRAAAEGGHLAVVDRLLENGAEINAPTASFNGRTALQAAAGAGNLVVIDRLLEKGAEVNAGAGEYSGRTALQAAAGRGHLAVVDRLLEKGADVNAQPGATFGRTALDAAAEGGHLAVVDRLLEKGAKVNATTIRSYTGTALDAAAGGGHLAVVDRLLENGADINAQLGERFGRTALEAASRGGHLAIVDRLLEKGAKVNVPISSLKSGTALEAAADGGYLAVVDRLIEKGAEVNARAVDISAPAALEVAAGRGYLSIVDRLLEKGAKVNAPPSLNGNTALQAAAGGGHLAVVDRLFEKGAEVNGPVNSCNGKTALQAAADGGYLAVVNRLLEKGAAVNAPSPDSYGRTALQAAAGHGYLAIVDRLIKVGAEVNAPPSVGGKTALQAAAGGGHLAVVDRLLEKGAEVNAPAAERIGQTALQAAASGGHLAVVDRLLAKGAEVNTPAATPDGQTALQEAARGGHLDVVDRLLEKGAEVNAPAATPDGQTALRAAARGGHWAVVKRLQQAGAL